MLHGKITIEHTVSDQGRVNIPVTAYLGCGLADVNCNGDVDISDIQTVAGRWETPAGTEYYYDLNDDGLIDLSDIQTAAELWRTVYAP